MYYSGLNSGLKNPLKFDKYFIKFRVFSQGLKKLPKIP